MAERWQAELRKLADIQPRAELWDRAVTTAETRVGDFVVVDRTQVGRRRLWSALGAAIAIALVAAAFITIRTGAFGGQPSFASTGKALGLGGRGDWPRNLAFSPDGKIIATADTDGTARFWSVATQREIGRPIRIGRAKVIDVAFSPDGRLVATADSDGTVRLWRVATRKQVSMIQAGRDRIIGVAFNPSGTLLATASEGGSARLWDVTTGRPVGRPMIPGGGCTRLRNGVRREVPCAVESVAFSPNGRLLATTYAFSARLWNVATQQPAGTPIGNDANGDGAVLEVAFSPDSKIIAGVGNGLTRLWSTRTARRIGSGMLSGTTDAYGVAFTPNGKVLVTTDTDGTIKLWNVATQRQVGKTYIPPSHPEFLTAALSPDGKLLATIQFLGPAQLWPLSELRAGRA